MEWISVKDELPRLRVFVEGGITKMDNSKEVIVTDGETSWPDYFSADDGFHPSITHWQPFPPPYKPINSTPIVK